MAKIIFYDATKTDEQQLTSYLSSTDHNWHYVYDVISPANIDPDAEVVSVFVSSTVTRQMIEAMPRLKLIACRSTGFNNIDLVAAEEHGITVVNVPLYGENTVAEYAFALLLTLTRRIPASLQSGMDTSRDALMGIDLSQKVIGVVGTGHIGQHAIAIAKGFNMEVLAHDPYPKQEIADEMGFSYVDLDELFARSDVITLHAPYTPQTHHLVNSEALSKMKSSAILVNTSRGELVDVDELVTALYDKRIAGAALDVVEDEVLLKSKKDVELVRDHTASEETLMHGLGIMALQKMPNVLVTPHNAYNTIEAVDRINKTTTENIVKFWYGETPNRIQPGPKNMGQLMIIRHAESEWNAEGKWTGTRDIHLTDRGFRQASLLAKAVGESGFQIGRAFCSEQVRTRETLEAILNATHQSGVPSDRVPAINERDYGNYTGKNKWEMQDLLGEEMFHRVRREWNEPIPNGETLKDVYARAVPWFESTVLPILKNGENVLIVAHGNSLRALTKFIEDISDEGIADVEMLFGHIVRYQLDDNGKMKHKEVVSVPFGEINA